MVSDWIAENIVEIFGAVTGIAYVILEIKRNIWLWPLGIVTSAVYIYVFGREGFYANMGLQGYYLVISVYGWYMWRRAQGNSAIIARSASSIVAPGDTQITLSPENPIARRASSIAEPADTQTTLSPENPIARRASSIVEPGDPQSPLPAENPENIDGTLKDAGTDILRIDRTTALWCAIASVTLWAVLWFILDRATDSPVPVWDGLIASLSVVATWMLTRKYIEQWYVWIFANAIAVAVYLASGLYPTAMLFLVYFGMAIVGAREWARDKAIGSRQ